MILNILAQNNQEGIWQQYLIPISFVGIFYFFLIRPQQKKQKEEQKMRESVKKGDDVVTIGGIHGSVTYSGDTTIKLKIAEDTVITIDKIAIGSKISVKEEAKKSS